VQARLTSQVTTLPPLWPPITCPLSSSSKGDVSARKIDDGVDDSDNLFDDLDDLSRLGTVPQVTGANHSPLNGSVSYAQPGQQDFELLDQNETSGNTTERKAQNRAAQRAFRERKERHLKDLQAKTQELEQTTNLMNEENSRLKAQLQALKMENNALKGQNITFSFPVPPPCNNTQLAFMGIGGLLFGSKSDDRVKRSVHRFRTGAPSQTKGNRI
jgi:bZIP transcription factor